MSKAVKKYIEEDVRELERLKKEIPLDKEYSVELIRYKEMYNLFNTTLKMAVINGTLTEYEAGDLRRKYARYRD